MKNFIALVAGLTFGLGLILSGMTSPDKVVGFLDVAGTWNPSLAFVMGSGLLVAAPFYWIARKRGTALTGDVLGKPAHEVIDKRLIGGAAIFGIGWGLVGLCPGPALVDLFAMPFEAGIFSAALVAGLLLSRRD